MLFYDGVHCLRQNVAATMFQYNMKLLKSRNKLNWILNSVKYVSKTWNFENGISLICNIKSIIIVFSVLYISLDGCCSRFDIYCFMLHIFQAINDSIFKLVMPIESSILLKNHVVILYKSITSQFHVDSLK